MSCVQGRRRLGRRRLCGRDHLPSARRESQAHAWPRAGSRLVRHRLAARKLEVAIGVPEKARPREKLALPIKIGGSDAGEEAEVTVAAVDIGILNLTGFKTPDPTGYFFGQRKLSVDVATSTAS